MVVAAVAVAAVVVAVAAVAVTVAAVVVVPGAAAGFARPVGAAVAEPEAAAHCSELQLGAPLP